MLMEPMKLLFALWSTQTIGYCMWQGNAASVVIKFTDGNLNNGFSLNTEKFITVMTWNPIY
jgi:hypothetical protein